MNMFGCAHCDGGFITKSERFLLPEGGTVVLKWCSNVHCEYNERISNTSDEANKFIEENILDN